MLFGFAAGSRTGHQAVDGDSAFLPKAVAAVLSLAVDLGIEVHVMQDHRVSARQIQPLAACTRAEEECKHPARRVVVPAHAAKPFCSSDKTMLRARQAHPYALRLRTQK